MKAIILLGTLKKNQPSNTEVLCDFLISRMKKKDIQCEIIKLVNHNIMTGTYSNMGSGDYWPTILNKILEAEMLIFATPIWWGGQSSEIQRVIERLDEIHDEILTGKKSKLYGKVGGIVITGDSDGAEHIIGNISNFFNAIGVIVPPYATLSVLWDMQAKGRNTKRATLMKKYQKDYTKTADTMLEQMVKYHL